MNDGVAVLGSARFSDNENRHSLRASIALFISNGTLNINPMMSRPYRKPTNTAAVLSFVLNVFRSIADQFFDLSQPDKVLLGGFVHENRNYKRVC